MMLLINAMIGSGILLQAYVFMKAGIVVALIEYLILGAMTYMGIHYLVIAAHRKGIYNYEALADELLGGSASIIVHLTIVLITFSSALSSLIFIGTLLQSAASSVGIDDWYTDIWFLCGIVVALFVLPFCLTREFDHLVGISMVSVSVLVGVMCLVIVDGSLLSHNYSSDSLNYGNYSGFMETVGFVAFAFSFIQSIFPAYTGLQERNAMVFSYTVMAATVAGIIMCLVTGLVGYLSFRDSTQEDILDNFSGAFGLAFKLAVSAHLMLYIPGDFVILRRSVFRLIGCNVLDVDNVTYTMWTTILLFFTTFVAVICQMYFGTSAALSLILSIPGGIGNSVLNFILPGTFIILSNAKEDASEYVYAMMLIVGGCVLTVLGCIGSVEYALSDE